MNCYFENLEVNYMETNDVNKTLLVIGNGFDLALGMESTFKKFGAYRKNILKKIPLTEWTIIDLLLEHFTHGFGEKKMTITFQAGIHLKII